MSIDWQNILFNSLGGLGLFSIVLKPWEKACNRPQGIAFDTILINIRVIPSRGSSRDWDDCFRFSLVQGLQ